MFVGLLSIPFGFSHPQQLLEYSSVISLQAAPHRSILSYSSSVFQLLDLHSLFICSLEKKATPHSLKKTNKQTLKTL